MLKLLIRNFSVVLLLVAFAAPSALAGLNPPTMQHLVQPTRARSDAEQNTSTRRVTKVSPQPLLRALQRLSLRQRYSETVRWRRMSTLSRQVMPRRSVSRLLSLGAANWYTSTSTLTTQHVL